MLAGLALRSGSLTSPSADRARGTRPPIGLTHLALKLNLDRLKAHPKDWRLWRCSEGLQQPFNRTPLDDLLHYYGPPDVAAALTLPARGLDPPIAFRVPRLDPPLPRR